MFKLLLHRKVVGYEFKKLILVTEVYFLLLRLQELNMRNTTYLNLLL